ncbi:soluble guanylate cyclase 88E-like isoform X3 [Oncorhynchus tshawytscha]|uniref:guanylate cyclase n=1 Tax=Oncorhynchus tshawytscha TaxID=74940 RepID=A0A8C8FT69_ONCTS|nr:soluble guanylate cyclase 88E-like isoform X3 [Oncorhynchus kisutch]XP_029518597.1 soluble guanylate cyclase 88E-like isoform X3 [Oncorhynchus nerka]XP_042158847.1 soluble guanylate cyclase 88E-like isoform X3 [Oncorhynchus tshawytscha]
MMYGLLCESLHDFIKESYGDDVWKLVRERADVRLHSFVTHQVYSESVIPRIAKAASGVTGTPYNELMNSWGVYFLGFVGKYGYDRILKVLGRHVRDFVNGLDNLHEYLRFSYPKVQPPTFFCQEESATGVTLHYRSKRKGYLHYAMGQLRQMGKQFYDTDIHVEVLSEQLVGDYSHVTMRLNFDNSAYRYIMKEDEEEQEILPITSDFFFEVFPFNIVFRQDMVVHNVGSGLATVFPDLDGKKINDAFLLARPLVEFTWNMIISHPNNLFEIMSKEPVKRERNLHNRVQNSDYENANRTADVDVELMAFQSIIGDDYKDGNSANAMESWGDGSRCLKLKGQMRYMPEWESIIFLGTPVMESLSAMFKTGLYINDLSMHDSSRDLVLAGTQQSEELKRALIQEQKKSSKLEESMKMLDYEMKKTDDLLYRMIPKPVAKRLRKGEPAVNTCEVFPDVTILFSDVVGFTRICSHITPMQVVSMLNTMYTLFDTLSEKHRVFKVETIGDAYMVVAGAPEKTKYHAHNICDMALDMVRSIDHLKDPSNGNNIQIRVGIHSGMVVAGVVGHKMPRYGLHGDTVHTASAMESNGKEMHIQLSSATYEHLKGSHFIFERRGTITIKGNVEIETYWLKGKRDKDGNAQAACPQFETQTISKAISKATISAPETSGDHDRLVFPSVAREDEDDVKSIRSHRIKMDISGHHSLVESLEECRAEEMSVSKVRRSHYKDALHHNNGLQDSHIELDSPEFDVHNSIMASPDGSIDSHCSEKSAMCSVS